MPKKSNVKPKKLILSKKDKIIAGVAGGIADYYSLDPALVRIITVVIIAILGVVPGVLLYWVSYIIIKKQS
ncbi:MAG: PspC domain-containing protein [Candidatus Saccharibacteria bacterium]